MQLNQVLHIEIYCVAGQGTTPSQFSQFHSSKAYAQQLFLSAAFKCCDFHLLDCFRAPHP